MQKRTRSARPGGSLGASTHRYTPLVYVFFHGAINPNIFLQTNIDGSVVSRRLVLGRLTQEIPTSVGSSSKCALRRSIRLTKRDEDIIKPTEVEMAHGDEEAEELEDEQDETSFRDERAENADPGADSNSVSDSEGSMPLHLSHESLGSGCTSVCFFVPRRKLSNASG